ncbi:MinD/ParA family ATP-binding protein [Dethiosulfatarculus sandiegensis]|uniref:CobQ/CobB/MinD/ParA nucleotide binding domain-containing protein n=1 Tax=Dethiosulfatarculus sandiegensis TaxID=1429043 RepID=A0A0D2HLY3_9BACT|nr:P-loop NTPase [Dethiosulfatarculus sandiegensis]KIX11593.1 hypothetical protein X474_24925 [Dethiosulfatarculus sandiegensis]
MPKNKIKKILPVVLPVGGGKGGTGRSLVTANLGLILARLEHKVVCVDADLGGSDLHNLLGLENDLAGLGEVLADKNLTVDQVVHPVLEPDFSFLPGDAMMVATANPVFQKKRKLLHDLGKLPCEFLLMDLGGGTSITVLDFFLASPLSLVLMLPEKPSALAAFNFIKNALFRAMDRIFRQNNRTKAVLEEYRRRGRGPGSVKLFELVMALEKAKPGEGKRAREIIKQMRPKLLLNRVKQVDDFVYAQQLEKWVATDLGVPLETLGFLPEDENLQQAAKKGVAAMDFDPASPFCRALTLIGLKLSPWAGRVSEYQEHKDYKDSFGRAATEFAPFFPPPV